MDFEPKHVNGMLCETYHEFYEARHEAIREAAERVRAMKEAGGAFASMFQGATPDDFPCIRGTL
jgi:hypothetical protein